MRRVLSGPLDDAAVEALLAGRPVAGERALAEVLSVVRSSAETVVPTAELAVLLATGVTVAPVAVQDTGRARRWTVRGVVAVVAVSTSLLGAASANALPGPLQRALGGLVQTLTPLELPGPTEDDRSPADPAAPPVVSGPGSDAVPTGEESGEPVSGSRAGGDVRSADDADGDDADAEDADGPDADGPDADGPDADGPDADGPDADGPDADGPDVDGPDVDGPDADGPYAEGPDDDAPAGRPAGEGPTGDPAVGDVEAGGSDTDDQQPDSESAGRSVVDQPTVDEAESEQPG